MNRKELESFVDGGRNDTMRLSCSRYKWNQTCAIGGQVSLCDRAVRSWEEAETYLECSRQTIMRHFGRGIRKLRFSDLEEMKISRGCQVVYRQVFNLKDMEEEVELGRNRGRVTFAWVRKENSDEQVFTMALVAALRSGRELLGFESEVACGVYEEPYGRMEAWKYIGKRRRCDSNACSVLQKLMIAKGRVKAVYWGSNIDHLAWGSVLERTEGAFFGGNTLVAAVKTAQKLGVRLYIFGKGAHRVSCALNRYYPFEKKGSWTTTSEFFR